MSNSQSDSSSHEKKSAYLEQVNGTLLQLISNFSAESRTPLNSAIGFSRILLENKDVGSLNEEQTEIVEVILKNTEYIHELHNHLLDISRFILREGISEKTNLVLLIQELKDVELHQSVTTPDIWIDRYWLLHVLEYILSLPTSPDLKKESSIKLSSNQRYVIIHIEVQLEQEETLWMAEQRLSFIQMNIEYLGGLLNWERASSNHFKVTFELPITKEQQS